MAGRPWIAPADVRKYTEFKEVHDRSSEKLAVDISRAEEYVIGYTGNRFDDPVQYPTLPESVRTAVLLLAEAYAHNAVESTKKLKSETFDDYSYTVAENNYIDIDSLGLNALLDEYKTATGSICMRLRKL